MNIGLVISVLLHAALLAWALITIQHAPVDRPPMFEPVAVALVTPDELTRLKKGDRSAKQLDAEARDAPKPDTPKKEAPKPKPVAAAEPPTGRPVKAGMLEASDQTLLVGFTDDVVVRVEGSSNRSRIDVRSASRYGKFDFGQNAARVRRFLAEIQARAEATSTGIARRGAAGARARALLKRQKAGDREKAESRTGRGPAQPNAQRAPAQKERPR